jgi:hypothetical protein
MTILTTILNKIASRIKDDFEFPKSMFRSSSHLLKKKLRQGPKIKKGKGKADSQKIYLPFAFYKSQECESLPADTKGDLGKLSHFMHECIQAVDSLSLKQQEDCIPFLSVLISISYQISDTYRSEFEKNLLVPNLTPLKERVRLIPYLCREETVIVDDHTVSRDIFIPSFRLLCRDTKYSKVTEDSSREAALKKQIHEIKDKRHRSQSGRA